MEVIWSTPARLQLAEAITRVAKDNPVAALNLDDKVVHVAERLQQFPNSGRVGRIKGTREVVISSYILVYIVFEDNVLVTHFVHSSRKFPPEGE